MMKNNPLVKPYLKWAGGKRQLLPEIKKQIPGDIEHYTYYEPFVGAGAVFFDLQPQRAVINDSNPQLILTYNVIKKNVKSLVELLREYRENNNKDFYYKIRNLDRDTGEFNKLSDIEKAGRLIFLNKTCFNGLYRVNSRGFFNVPYGKHKNPAIFDDAALSETSAYLNSNEISILNLDFEKTVLTANNNSFIYFDPPYHSPDKSNFTGYQAGGFNENEQKRLRDVMAEMTKRGVKCLLSNSDTAYIREIYNDSSFEIIPVKANRSINSDSSGRGKVNEVLIKNWKE